MITIQNKEALLRIFVDLVEELDVPPTKYEDAKNRYEVVGQWLNGDGSNLAGFAPEVYPQGSFALGTAIKPLGDEDYDVDVVCRLEASPKTITQEELKEIVGRRLKAHKTFEKMIDPKDGGRRCWTLKYSDDSHFHLDILPAIPDDPRWIISQGVPTGIAKHAICITDREVWGASSEWPKSNPQGYVSWFNDRMRVIFEERRRILAKEMRANVQDIPDYTVQTPLQQVIKLLKRHRDKKYNGDDDKPISIIITTLAAKAYNNQSDLLETLLSIVPGMRNYIENRNGIWWIENPVNPQENFADKWNETPRKQELFFEWLNTLEKEHKDLLNDSNFENLSYILSASYGQRETASVLKKYSTRTGKTLPALVSSRALSNFSVPHRQTPQWPVVPQYKVTIKARAWRNGWRSLNFSNGSAAIPKDHNLKFFANTNVPPPFEVSWQVVNTGEEARRANQLRGDFYSGEGGNVLERKETTRYRGMHWIECFIIKDRKCVARSGEFIVNIK
jgi:hypothetical protein